MSLRRRIQESRERGETLLELVISLAILGIVVVAVFGSIMVAIHFSTVHRNEVKASDYLRSAAESIENVVATPANGNPDGYVASCSASTLTTDYLAGYSTGDTNFHASITAVGLWTGTQFQTCTTNPNTTGLEQLTVQVVTTDGSVKETLTMVVRTTCSSGTTCS
jgi:type II secretory pathway pseudopilin PulG